MDDPSGEMLADRRARAAEIAVERERERRTEAEAMIVELTARIELLGRELVGAREEPERLRTVAEEHARRRRAAEQREHAERAARIELQIERDQLVARVEGAEPEAAPGGLAAELEQLREIVEREGAARAWAEARAAQRERQLRDCATRTGRVYDAVAELRGLLDAVRGERGAGAVEAERLDAARARLREMTPPRESSQQAGETAVRAVRGARGVRSDAYAR